MKRLYILLAVLILTASYASAQITTERCFHLDKVQFLQHKQDFWRSHKLYSTAARETSGFQEAILTLLKDSMVSGSALTDKPYADHYAGITTVNGFLFGGGLALGVGVGYHQYNEGYDVPIYGDIRWYMGKERVKFFVMGSGGFMANFNDFNDLSRIFVNPGGGIIVPLSKNMHLSFAVGLLTQWDRGYITENPEGYRDSFINMKLGLLFGK